MQKTYTPISFRRKLILLLGCFVLVPVAVVGILAINIMNGIQQERMKDVGVLLIQNEHERLSQMARNQALLLNQVLSDNQEAVHSLLKQYEINAAAYPQSKPTYGFEYYSDKDRAGLPGYGYCHPQYGAFADWERLAGGVSPWIPKRVVEKARADAAFNTVVTDTLFKAATLKNSFVTYQQTHKELIDLVWLVSTTGVAYTYPTDYAAKINANPAMNDLDENQEPYVLNFTPANNPRREARWLPVYLDAIQRRFMTSFVAPIYEGDTFMGTLGVDVLLPGLVQDLSKETVGKRGYALLLDSAGAPLALPAQNIQDWVAEPEVRQALSQVVSSAASSQWSSETVKRAQRPLRESATPACRELLAHIAREDKGAATIQLGTEEYFVSFHIVPCVSWKVIYVRPLDEITAVAASGQEINERQAVSVILAFGGIIAFVLLMSVAVGVWASRQVTKPIANIVAAADRIARDPADAPEIVVSSRDEFQSLAESLNSMTRTLRRSEAKYRELVENANSIILRVDMEGRITFFNEFAVKFFGYTEEEIIGKPGIGTILPAVDSSGKDLRSLFAGLLRNPDQFMYNENENMRKNGESVWVAWSNKLVPGEGDAADEILCIGNDITERRRMELQLLQAQRMEAIGQLAGGVAHDFNNLLHAILGYLEMAQSSVDDHDECLSDINEAYRAGERAAAITKQLLAFSRRQVLQLKSLDLNEVVEDLMKMIRRLIGENIELVVNSSGGLALIMADRAQIEQVLMNLCVNARDAMPDGGKLMIETSEVYCDDHCACHAQDALPIGRYVLLRVRDTGCGMDAQTKQQIFEPFFTTKALGKGTGLGLPMIYGIVHQHGGAIGVNSEPGHGTEFSIWLPLAEATPEVSGHVSHAPVHGGMETILLAEDEEQIQRLTRITLGNAGYRVLAASDGEEALRVFREHDGEIHLLLLDVVMPNKGGRAVYEEIRGEKPEIKCLFVSGYSEAGIHTNFILKEGLQLLNKPYQRDELLRAVRALLDA